MRREDKRKLPPKIKLNLPKGFYVTRIPGEYLLYQTDGLVHQLVCGFVDSIPAEVIEGAATRQNEGAPIWAAP